MVTLSRFDAFMGALEREVCRKESNRQKKFGKTATGKVGEGESRETKGWQVGLRHFRKEYFLDNTSGLCLENVRKTRKRKRRRKKKRKSRGGWNTMYSSGWYCQIHVLPEKLDRIENEWYHLQVQQSVQSWTSKAEQTWSQKKILAGMIVNKYCMVDIALWVE